MERWKAEDSVQPIDVIGVSKENGRAGDTLGCRLLPSGFTRAPMHMQPVSIAIIGAPVGAWALYGCLSLAGVSNEAAVTAGTAWAVFWMAMARFGTHRGGVAGSMLGGAIVTSLFAPLPIYLLTIASAWLSFVPVGVGLPMFTTLCSAAPLLFWIMALKPRRRRQPTAPLMVMQFTQYNPRQPAASLPPRNSTMRRAV